MLSKLLVGKNIDWFLTFFLGIILGLLALDSYGSPQTVQKFLSVSASQLLIPAILMQLLFRRLLNARYIPLAKYGVMGLALGLSAIIIGLSFYGANKHPNAVYTLTHLNLSQLTNILVLAGLSLLIDQTLSWWRKHWAVVLIIAPLVIFLLFYCVSLWPLNFFKEIVKEDHLVENLQFWVLFLGFVSQIPVLIQHFRTKKYHRLVFSSIMMFGFALVAGDEISWGQRLLGFETGESLQEINRQGETTFHNLYLFEWLVIYAYTSLSFMGVLLGFSVWLYSRLRSWQLLSPLALLIGFFIFPLIFFAQQLRVMWGVWHSWSEVAELSLYSGLVLWIVLFEHWPKLQKFLPTSLKKY